MTLSRAKSRIASPSLARPCRKVWTSTCDIARQSYGKFMGCRTVHALRLLDSWDERRSDCLCKPEPLHDVPTARRHPRCHGATGCPWACVRPFPPKLICTLVPCCCAAEVRTSRAAGGGTEGGRNETTTAPGCIPRRPPAVPWLLVRRPREPYVRLLAKSATRWRCNLNAKKRLIFDRKWRPNPTLAYAENVSSSTI